MSDTESSELTRIKQRFAKKRVVLYSADIGEIGEAWATEWLTENKCQFLPIDAKPDDMPARLREMGGKRPDFVAHAGEDCIFLLDAKINLTDDCTWFTMSYEEIHKYRNGVLFLLEYLKESKDDRAVETWFMLFPAERKGARLVFVPLTDLEAGIPATTLKGEPGRKVNITQREGFWFNHAPKRAWGKEADVK